MCCPKDSTLSEIPAIFTLFCLFLFIFWYFFLVFMTQTCPGINFKSLWPSRASDNYEKTVLTPEIYVFVPYFIVPLRNVGFPHRRGNFFWICAKWHGFLANGFFFITIVTFSGVLIIILEPSVIILTVVVVIQNLLIEICWGLLPVFQALFFGKTEAPVSVPNFRWQNY